MTSSPTWTDADHASVRAAQLQVLDVLVDNAQAVGSDGGGERKVISIRSSVIEHANLVLGTTLTPTARRLVVERAAVNVLLAPHERGEVRRQLAEGTLAPDVTWLVERAQSLGRFPRGVRQVTPGVLREHAAKGSQLASGGSDLLRGAAGRLDLVTRDLIVLGSRGDREMDRSIALPAITNDPPTTIAARLVDQHALAYELVRLATVAYPDGAAILAPSGIGSSHGRSSIR